MLMWHNPYRKFFYPYGISHFFCWINLLVEFYHVLAKVNGSWPGICHNPGIISSDLYCGLCILANVTLLTGSNKSIAINDGTAIKVWIDFFISTDLKSKKTVQILCLKSRKRMTVVILFISIEFSYKSIGFFMWLPFSLPYFTFFKVKKVEWTQRVEKSI